MCDSDLEDGEIEGEVAPDIPVEQDWSGPFIEMDSWRHDEEERKAKRQRKERKHGVEDHASPDKKHKKNKKDKHSSKQPENQSKQGSDLPALLPGKQYFDVYGPNVSTHRLPCSYNDMQMCGTVRPCCGTHTNSTIIQAMLAV